MNKFVIKMWGMVLKWLKITDSILMSSVEVVEFGWNITSVFFMLSFWPNFDDVVAKASTILCIASAAWAIIF